MTETTANKEYARSEKSPESQQHEASEPKRLFEEKVADSQYYREEERICLRFA
jgi:hypothetical protein